MRQVVLVRHHQLVPAAQDLRAFLGGACGPGRDCGRRRCVDRAARLGRAHVRHGADDLGGRRVEYLVVATVVGIHPFAVDEGLRRSRVPESFSFMALGQCLSRTSVLAGQMAGKESERARARQRGGFSVVAGALVAIEAVTGVLVEDSRPGWAARRSAPRRWPECSCPGCRSDTSRGISVFCRGSPLPCRSIQLHTPAAARRRRRMTLRRPNSSRLLRCGRSV